MMWHHDDSISSVNIDFIFQTHAVDDSGSPTDIDNNLHLTFTLHAFPHNICAFESYRPEHIGKVDIKVRSTFIAFLYARLLDKTHYGMEIFPSVNNAYNNSENTFHYQFIFGHIISSFGLYWDLFPENQHRSWLNMHIITPWHILASTCCSQSLYLNQCYLIVNWTHGSTFQWNFNRNTMLVQENSLENVIWNMALYRSGFNVLTLGPFY